MPIRLVITLNAAQGKGEALAEAFRARCQEVMIEPGCEQFEIFRSALDPDKLVLLERWSDQAALDAHAEMNRTREPLPADLRGGVFEREDYEYTRTRERRP
jgi:quinol monooxygenase YgiN